MFENKLIFPTKKESHIVKKDGLSPKNPEDSASSDYEKLPTTEQLSLNLQEIDSLSREMLNNPQVTEATKQKVQSLASRGQSLFLKGLLLLSLIGAVTIEAKSQNSDSPNNSDIPENLAVDTEQATTTQLAIEQSNLQEKIANYQHLGFFLATNIAMEEPTDYQIKQMEDLQAQVIKNLEGQNFSSFSDLLAVINEQLDNDFSSKTSIIHLKDAFSEGPDVSPRGHLDCDSRAILALAILEKLNVKSDQIELCLLADHAVLYIKEETAFFELTNNQVRQLTEEEKLQLNNINSLEKYWAYLLSKEGLSLAQESQGNVFLNDLGDRQKRQLAIDKMTTAAQLDPANLNNNLNLLRLGRQSNQEILTPQVVDQIASNVKRGLLNNFYNISEAESSQETLLLTSEEIHSGKLQPRRLEDLGSIEKLTKEALAKSDYLRRQFCRLGEDLYYKFNNYQAASQIFADLSAGYQNNLDKNNSFDYILYQTMLAKSYFQAKDYQQFLSLASNGLHYALTDRSKNQLLQNFKNNALEELTYQITAAEIITGQLKLDSSNVEDFCQKYLENPLLRPLIINRPSWPAAAIEAITTLEGWAGFPEFVAILQARHPVEKINSKN